MSLTDFTVYQADGTILRSGACPEDMCESQAITANGEYVIYTKADVATDRVDISNPDPDYHAPVPKQAHSMTINKTTFTADGTDYVRINSVPTDARVWIITDTTLGLTNIINQAVPDGWVEVTTTQVGDYVITIDNGVLLPYEVTVHAV